MDDILILNVLFGWLNFVAENLHNVNKGNSLARSNASLYGNKEELYDRLRRHAYQGKKGTPSIGFNSQQTINIQTIHNNYREKWQRDDQRKWRTLDHFLFVCLFFFDNDFVWINCHFFCVYWFEKLNPKSFSIFFDSPMRSKGHRQNFRLEGNFFVYFNPGVFSFPKKKPVLLSPYSCLDWRNLLISQIATLGRFTRPRFSSQSENERPVNKKSVVDHLPYFFLLFDNYLLFDGDLNLWLKRTLFTTFPSVIISNYN